MNVSSIGLLVSQMRPPRYPVPRSVRRASGAQTQGGLVLRAGDAPGKGEAWEWAEGGVVRSQGPGMGGHFPHPGFTFPPCHGQPVEIPVYPRLLVDMVAWGFTEDLMRKPHPALGSSQQLLLTWLSHAKALRPDKGRLK